MPNFPDPTDWDAARGFSGFGFQIGQCEWCGDGFVRLRLVCKPQLTCSPKCQAEKRAEYYRSAGRHGDRKRPAPVR